MIALQSHQVANMSSITVRNLDDTVKTELRLRAAHHGHSMEQEVRDILRQAVARGTPDTGNLAERINRLFKGLGGEDITIPARQPGRTPPSFDMQ